MYKMDGNYQIVFIQKYISKEVKKYLTNTNKVLVKQ